jgi:hypothetical protein
VHRKQLLVPLAAIAFALAACGGAAPTQAPPATQPGGGGATATDSPTEPTEAPPATQPGGGAGGGGAGGGGGGSGGGGTGSVSYTVTGDVQKTGELPFFAFGIRFERDGPAGVALNFTTEDGGAIFSIGEIAGMHTVALVDEQHGLNWTNCETFELNISGTNATGRFECREGFGTVVADGSLVNDIQISGTFEAHA